MTNSAHSPFPEIDFGLTSAVLGAVGLMLFVLPILAIPIAGFGWIVGACGFVAAAIGKSVDLRLPLAGIAICSLALAIALAIDFAPGGYFRFPAEPSLAAPLPKPPYVPAPAPLETGASSRETVKSASFIR